MQYLRFLGIISNSRSANLGKLLNKPTNWPNPKKKGLNRSFTHHGGLNEPSSNASERLIVKENNLRVLLHTGSSGDLLFIKKGSHTYIPTLKRSVSQSWGTSNGTFQTKEVGMINLCFVEYSRSKSVHLTPDIVEYEAGAPSPLYDLITDKQTLHDIGAILDFKEKTITIDSNLLQT